MDHTHPLILSMDTATPCSSVALTTGTRRQGRVVASLCLRGKVTHSRRLLSAIDFLMKETETDWRAVDGIGVSIGPGSFTGLRIGMASAKGLADGTGKYLFGVSTLDGLAGKCITPRLICAVLDARKKEVYAAFYRCDCEGFAERISEMSVVSPEKLVTNIDEPVLMVGDGAVLYREIFHELLGEKVAFAPAQLHEPTASSLGMIAGEMFEKNEQLDVGEAVPLYIRRSDAELNLVEKQGHVAVKGLRE